MKKVVLVAVRAWADGPRLALATATLLPDARAEVVHVIEEGDQAVADQIVADAVATLREQGVQADGHVAWKLGLPVADRLTVEAGEQAAQLVVLGSRGRAQPGALAGASVSHEVPMLTGAAVLVVPDWARLPRQPARRVLMAVDGEQDLSPALHALSVLSAHREVLVLHVASRAAVPVPERDPSELAEMPADLLEHVSRRLRGAGLQVGTRLLAGGEPVAQAIVNAARDWDADLVLLCSHRAGALAGLLEGSTAEGVLRESDRPVALAPTSP